MKYTALHNAFAILAVSNNPTIESNDEEHIIVHLTQLAKAVESTKQKRLQQRNRRKYVKYTLRRLQESEELFFDKNITRAEDEQTTMEKEDTSKAQHCWAFYGRFRLFVKVRKQGIGVFFNTYILVVTGF
jgi:hypothetical protein